MVTVLCLEGFLSLTCWIEELFLKREIIKNKYLRYLLCIFSIGLTLLYWSKKTHKIAVLWIGIVLMPIRIRISMLMAIRIRIGIMRLLPQVLHILDNQNFFSRYFNSQHCHFTMFYLSNQCQKCVIIFQNFGQHRYLSFLEKKLILSTFLLFEIDRIGMPWMPMPIPIRIRQNDADPTRSWSRSTTLQNTYVFWFFPPTYQRWAWSVSWAPCRGGPGSLQRISCTSLWRPFHARNYPLDSHPGIIVWRFMFNGSTLI